MRWAKAPSSVSNTKPVVSLSSRPAGNSPLRLSAEGTKSSTVGSPLPSVAESTPVGLLSIKYTKARQAMGSPARQISWVSGSACCPARATMPSTVTCPFCSSVLTRLRGSFNSRASIFSIRSLICVFPIPAYSRPWQRCCTDLHRSLCRY